MCFRLGVPMCNFEGAPYIWFTGPVDKSEPSSPKPSSEDRNTATAASTLGGRHSVPWQALGFAVFDLGLGEVLESSSISGLGGCMNAPITPKPLHHDC